MEPEDIGQNQGVGVTFKGHGFWKVEILQILFSDPEGTRTIGLAPCRNGTVGLVLLPGQTGGRELVAPRDVFERSVIRADRTMRAAAHCTCETPARGFPCAASASSPAARA